MTDVRRPGGPGDQRLDHGRRVIGRPGAPGAPGCRRRRRRARRSWCRSRTAAPNGAPVEYYTVYTNGAPHQCAGLAVHDHRAGQRHQLHGVRHGDQQRRPERAQRAPTTVTPERGARPGDRARRPPPGDGTGHADLAARADAAPRSPATRSRSARRRPAQQQITAVGRRRRRTTFAGLADGTAYTFTVMAVNAVGNGPWSLGVTATPFGKPATMAAPTAAGAAPVITVTWAPAQGNGQPGHLLHRARVPGDGRSGPWSPRSAPRP